MLMGSYRGAREDFDMAMELLSSSSSTIDTKEREAEIDALTNEMVKLGRLTEAGQKSRVKCKKAMKKILDGGDGEKDETLRNIPKIKSSYSSTAAQSAIMQHSPDATVDALERKKDSGQDSTGLHEDMTKRRAYLTLRARRPKKKASHCARRRGILLCVLVH